MNLESYCEGLKEQLHRYQHFIYEDEDYRERASSSMIKQVFPALPMRPQLVSSLYFAAEDLDSVGVKEIVKTTYHHPVTDVVNDNANVSLDDVKGKSLVELHLSKAYKNFIRGLVQQKKDPTVL